MEKQPGDQPKRSKNELMLILRGAHFITLNFPKAPDHIIRKGHDAFERLQEQGVNPIDIAENLASLTNQFKVDDKRN
jgi:hypothetical protein